MIVLLLLTVIGLLIWIGSTVHGAAEQYRLKGTILDDQVKHLELGPELPMQAIRDSRGRFSKKVASRRKR